MELREHSIALREHYFENQRYFFAMIVTYIVATFLHATLAATELRLDQSMLLRLAFLASVVPLMFTRSVGYHAFATLAVLVLLVYRLAHQVLRA